MQQPRIMGRPLRLLTPSTTWFVTSRCIDARLLLRPDPALNAALGFCLARACQRYPGITLFGFVALSNHLHILLVDPHSELSGFMELFLGTLAKAVNGLRERRGHVFERRFSAEPVLDPWALKERWLYLVLNPVRAGLVERHEQWPGLCLFASDSAPRRYVFRRFHKERYDAALRATPAGRPRPSPTEFYEERVVVLSPLPRTILQTDGSSAGKTLLEEVRHWEGRIAEQRRQQGVRFLGSKQVLAQRVFSMPRVVKRSPRPLCHTVIAAMHAWYRQIARTLQQAYAAASGAYRRGALLTEFPRFTFRPSVPILEGRCVGSVEVY